MMQEAKFDWFGRDGHFRVDSSSTKQSCVALCTPFVLYYQSAASLTEQVDTTTIRMLHAIRPLSDGFQVRALLRPCWGYPRIRSPGGYAQPSLLTDGYGYSRAQP